jgi:hypothetical protein
VAAVAVAGWSLWQSLTVGEEISAARASLAIAEVEVLRADRIETGSLALVTPSGYTTGHLTAGEDSASLSLRASSAGEAGEPPASITLNAYPFATEINARHGRQVFAVRLGGSLMSLAMWESSAESQVRRFEAQIYEDSVRLSANVREPGERAGRTATAVIGADEATLSYHGADESPRVLDLTSLQPREDSSTENAEPNGDE